MDDILREIDRRNIDEKLNEINNIHPSLQFTIEREKYSSISFLDMLINRSGTRLSSKWYTKPTDTGLTMNFHALAPAKYKRSVVTGLIHRIHRACSTWQNFHQSLEKAKSMLRNNQYSQQFYEPIISRTLTNIIKSRENQDNESEEQEQSEEKMVFLQYRGKVSEKFEWALKRLKIPCKVIFTLKSLRMELPSLKPAVEKCFKSRLVYKISCPRCSSCYVGQTSRHVITRLKEHKRPGPVGNHFKECKVELSIDCVSILCVTSRSTFHLMALEALMINELEPVLNTKDEYRSRALVIKF